jgi:hypothetical protein
MKDGKKKEVRSPKKSKKLPAYKLVLKDGALEYHLLPSNSSKKSK